MKKLIFMVFAVAMATCTYAQKTDSHVGSGWYITLPSKDTVRTFHFFQTDIDTCRNRMIKYWGTPAQNTAGRLSWANISIPNIGNELNVTLTDEFCTQTYDKLSCRTFTSEKDKAKKLKNMKSNQYRNVTITFMDKANKNLIMDKTKVDVIVQLLARIIQ